MNGVRVRSVAIGGRDADGQQRRAIPFDLVPEPAATVPTKLWCDWESAAELAGLTPVERQLFFARWRDCEIDAIRTTRLSQQQMGAVTRSLDRKLRQNAGALRSCFSELTHEELLIEEFWATAVSGPSLKPSYRSPIVKIAELRTELDRAQQTRDRLVGRMKEQRQAVKDAEEEVARVADAIREAAIADLLENRKTANTIGSKVESTTAKLTAARAALDVSEEALNRQCAVVQDLESQIAGCRREVLEAEIAQPRKRLDRAMREVSEAIVECVMVTQKHGFPLFDVLYPLTTDPLPGMQLRFAKMTLAEAADQLHRHLFAGKGPSE